jgi:CBS domain-containing protein
MSFELTHDANVFLPLLVGSVIAHGFTVLALRRSILTEKVARRGYHLSREYAVDPLEILFVSEVMRTNVLVLPDDGKVSQIPESISTDPHRNQRLIPVVNANVQLVGIITREAMRNAVKDESESASGQTLGDLARKDTIAAYPDEPLRVVVYRMAEHGLTRLPVVDPTTKKLLGLVSLNDLLKGRARHLEEERRRERTLSFKFFRIGRQVQVKPVDLQAP